MGLTSAKATDIALKHGLSLQDAAGLAALAETETEAEALAAKFAGPEEQMRARVRAMFKPQPASGFKISIPLRDADEGGDSE